MSNASAHAHHRRKKMEKHTVLGEVLLSQFVFLDLEATLEQLLSSLTTDGHMYCNFFVSLDAEGTDGVLGLGLDGSLLREIAKHLGGLGEFIAGLTRAEVKDELIDLDIPHQVVLLLQVLCLVHIFFLNQLNLLIIIGNPPIP